MNNYPLDPGIHPAQILRARIAGVKSINCYNCTFCHPEEGLGWCQKHRSQPRHSPREHRWSYETTCDQYFFDPDPPRP